MNEMGIRLGEICQFQSGGTPSRKCPEYFNGDIPWVTTTALNGGTISFDDANELITLKAIEESAAKLVPAHSILVGTRVGVGKTAINLIPMSTSQDIISLTAIDEHKWYKEFICRFISSKQNYLVSKARGATIKGIKIETLADLEIPEISIPEQHFIVTVFDKLNFLISSRKQQLVKLDELVKARFVEMFGNVGTDEKSWGLARLGDVCKINPKKTDDTKLKPDLQVSFVPMPAVSEKGEIDPSEIKVYDEVKTGFTYFREDDVLFAKITPCMENGKGAIAKGLCNGIGFGSTEFHVLRPIGNISNSYWIYAVTSFEQFRVDAASNMTGSAGQRRVPASFLESYRVSIPPIELQNEFANFVKQVDKSKFAVQKALDEAQTLFDSLMQQYFG